MPDSPERPQRLALALILLGALLLLLQGDLLAAPLVRFLVLVVLGVALLRGGSSLGRWPRLVLVGALVVVALPLLGGLAGAFVLGAPGLLFTALYLRDRRRWWAVIPAGALFSLAAVALFEQLFPGWNAAPLFLLGLGATFSYLYLLPDGRGGQRWAIYPALGCIVLTLLSNDPSGGGSSWLFPLGFIIAGLGLWWWWGKRRS